MDPDLKNKSDSEDIKFDLKLRNNKIVLNKETNKESKEDKKKCCKWKDKRSYKIEFRICFILSENSLVIMFFD